MLPTLLLLLTACDGPADEPPAQPARKPAPAEIPPPYGGEADPTGTILKCPEFRSSPLRSWWYVFADKDIADPDCTVGASQSKLHTVPLDDGTGPCNIGWSGEVTKQEGNAAFAGVGTALLWSDLSPYAGVRIATRGDGRNYRFEIGMLDQINSLEEGCDDPDLDFYGSDFACGDGTNAWHSRELLFEGMKQTGWGKIRELQLGTVERIQVVTREVGPFQCDFWVEALLMANGSEINLGFPANEAGPGPDGSALPNPDASLGDGSATPAAEDGQPPRDPKDRSFRQRRERRRAPVPTDQSGE